MPLLSIIIPTRDRASELARCLEALRPESQGIPADEYEVIVSDDARSDELRRHLEAQFRFVRWVPGPAKGPAVNRNHGAQQARGSWLVFTDDDCIPRAGWLSAIRRSVAMGESLAIEGRVVSDPGPSSAWDEAPVNPGGGCFWSCNIAVQAEAFRKLGGFDEHYPSAVMEDVDLREALKRAGIAPVFVADAEVNHPARKGGVRLRWSRLKHHLPAHVYFRRKWFGPHPLREFLDLARALGWHWLVVPLRRGSLFQAALFFPAFAYLVAGFCGWYRRASRTVG